MSIRRMDDVLRYSTQTGNSLLILLLLADWANDDGECFPAIPSIAKKARLSERRTQSIIRELVAAGELEVDRGQGVRTRTGRTNLYRIKVSAQEVKPASPLKQDDEDNEQESGENIARGDRRITPPPAQEVIVGSPDPSLKDQPSVNTSLPVATAVRKRGKNLTYEAVRNAFKLDNPGVIQLYASMLTGKDTKKKTAWNACRMTTGLRPYEIHLFGEWMRETAEEKNLTPPRRPETIVQWIADWKQDMLSKRQNDALSRAHTTFVDSEGNPFRNQDPQFWQGVIQREFEAAEAEWEARFSEE